ncbi:MAG: nucleoside recognition domain-containing protein, partial [Christensenellales bacterium]
PNYRFPSPKSVLLLMWEKAKDFVVKAFTVIFIATVIIWFLQSFDVRFNFVTDSSQSMLAAIGSFISPIFKPLGFADWRVCASLIAGFSAKEAVVSTLGILIPGGIATAFSAASAYSFLIFTLLYTPCVAAITAIRKELKSVPLAIGVVAAQCVIAWVVACIVYQLIVVCGG